MPVFALFFLDDAGGLLAAGRRSSLLADLGLAAIGALVSSIGGQLAGARPARPADARCPLLVPVMIARRRRAPSRCWPRAAPYYAGFGKWMAVLALYDVVFCLVGYAVYDFLLED